MELALDLQTHSHVHGDQAASWAWWAIHIQHACDMLDCTSMQARINVDSMP